jgi:hypothetical protein
MHLNPPPYEAQNMISMQNVGYILSGRCFVGWKFYVEERIFPLYLEIFGPNGLDF